MATTVYIVGAVLVLFLWTVGNGRVRRRFLFVLLYLGVPLAEPHQRLCCSTRSVCFLPRSILARRTDQLARRIPVQFSPHQLAKGANL